MTIHRTLIGLQQEAIERLDVSRTSDRRYAKYRGVVRHWYLTQMVLLGWSKAQAEATWRDVRDMSELRRACEAIEEAA